MEEDYLKTKKDFYNNKEMNFRNEDFFERYKDVYFKLETPLVTANPANNASQEKAGYRFTVDTTNSTNPLD